MPLNALKELGVNAAALVAGFSGGVVAAFVMRKVRPYDAVGSVIVGALTANYLDEIVGKLSGVGGGAASFITGLVAMAICQGIIEVARGAISKWTTGGRQ